MGLRVITQTSTLLNHKRIHVEISSKCTLKCPRCPRTELDPTTLNKEITLEEFKHAFPRDLLEDINEIMFCGDIGDPIYARDFLEIIKYVKKTLTVSVSIVTNGSYKSPAWWEDLGTHLRYNDKITFSVDGWDQASNEQYRVNSDFKSIVDGVRALRAVTHAQLIWSAIYFRYNETQFNSIKTLAKELGFDTFQTVRSSKFGPNYFVNGVDPLMPTNKFIAKTAQYESDIEQLNRYSPKPIVFHDVRDVHPWARCANWTKEMFINVEGLVFPCPWFNGGYLENDFVEKYKNQINIKTRTLKEIISDPLWDELYTRFAVAPLDICRMKCESCQ